MVCGSVGFAAILYKTTGAASLLRFWMFLHCKSYPAKPRHKLKADGPERCFHSPASALEAPKFALVVSFRHETRLDEFSGVGLSHILTSSYILLPA